MSQPPPADQHERCVRLARALLLRQLQQGTPLAGAPALIEDSEHVFRYFPRTPDAIAAQQFLLALQQKADADESAPVMASFPGSSAAASSSGSAAASSSVPAIPRDDALPLIVDLLAGHATRLAEEMGSLDGGSAQYRNLDAMRCLWRVERLENTLGSHAYELHDFVEIRRTGNDFARDGDSQVESILSDMNRWFKQLHRLAPSLTDPISDNDSDSGSSAGEDIDDSIDEHDFLDSDTEFVVRPIMHSADCKCSPCGGSSGTVTHSSSCDCSTCRARGEPAERKESDPDPQFTSDEDTIKGREYVQRLKLKLKRAVAISRDSAYHNALKEIYRWYNKKLTLMDSPAALITTNIRRAKKYASQLRRQHNSLHGHA